MTKEQLDAIVAILAGQSGAIIHLSLKVAEIAELDKAQFADSFRKTADMLDESVANREIVAMAIRQIANGMDSAQPAEADISDDIRDMLH